MKQTFEKVWDVLVDLSMFHDRENTSEIAVISCLELFMWCRDTRADVHVTGMYISLLARKPACLCSSMKKI